MGGGGGVNAHSYFILHAEKGGKGVGIGCTNARLINGGPLPYLSVSPLHLLHVK